MTAKTSIDASVRTRPGLPWPVLGLGLLLLAGCGSKLPPSLAQDPPQAPSLQQVRLDPDQHRAQRVRWGGVIAATEHPDSSTLISIVALELDGNGRPHDRDNSLGRFIAVVDRFLEPLTYQQGRLITVSGVVDGVRPQNIGDFRYEHPVIRVDALHLWPRRSARPVNPYLYPQPYYWPYRPWYHPLHNPFPYAPIPYTH